MSRMNRRRFTWLATSGVASAALVACGNSDEEDLTPTRIADVEGAPPTLAPNATPPDTSEEEATPVEGGGGAQAQEVDMENDLVFHPAELTVNVGDTVKWVNNGALIHTTTCDPEVAMNPEDAQLPDGAETWNSGDMNQGDEFEYTFEVAGDYTYFCIPHEATGMIGHITVQEGGGAGEEAPAEESPEATAAEEEAAAGSGGGGGAITVTGLDSLTFDPSEFEASPGQTIHFVNGGALQHDFRVDELGIEMDLLNGGEETDVTVPDDAEVGAEYVYYCSAPGHREAGMEGTLTIVEA